ncbi:hypothetical protein L6452_37668 [Arctium lappa]|uniref:Uncharacterized protein n=1 Tax=Arctium lappa TaxID=4217 RepID=A0ACB8Y4Q8_ARCLA|nr:hypothetical protein L6452_37668 [Arctium lappa]
MYAVHTRREEKEGGCVWSLPTIWSIFFGDLVASIFSGDMRPPYSTAIWFLPLGGRWMSCRFCPRGSTLLCFLYSFVSKTANHMVKAVAEQDVKQLQKKIVYRGGDG